MKFTYVVIPVMLAAVIGLAAAPAFAETSTTTATTTAKLRGHDKIEARLGIEFDKLLRKSGPSVHIGMGGRAQLDAAKVTAVSGSEVTVALFGHSYKVKTDGAKMKNDVSIAVGSHIWVKGKVDPATGVITADQVRAFTPKMKDGDEMATTTMKVKPSADFQVELKALLEKLKALQGR